MHKYIYFSFVLGYGLNKTVDSIVWKPLKQVLKHKLTYKISEEDGRRNESKQAHEHEAQAHCYCLVFLFNTPVQQCEIYFQFRPPAQERC